jgi:hypothetical protein
VLTAVEGLFVAFFCRSYFRCISTAPDDFISVQLCDIIDVRVMALIQEGLLQCLFLMLSFLIFII